MARNYEDQSSIRRYLLNQLTGEVQQFEQRLLMEDGFFEELEIAEDELIDKYLSEDLSDDDRARFEQYFLATPERQQKVRFSRTLSRYLRANESHENSTALSPPHFWTTHNWALPLAAAVAVAVIVAGIFWIFRPGTPSLPTLATFTLTNSNATRGEGTQATKVTLPRNVDVVRLLLKLPESAKPQTRYRVQLVTQNGETLTLSTVGQDGQSVFVDIPAARLSRGQYAVHLYAVQSDRTEQRITGNYYFTVE